MWSLIKEFEYEITNTIADFHKIYYKGKKIDVKLFNQLHEKSFEFIQNETNDESQKIVITHHLPSNLCNVDEFKNSSYNDAFCVDKTEFIKQSNIDYWIYGHSHRNMKNFEINGTKMITNQLGYVARGEQIGFERDKIIKL